LYLVDLEVIVKEIFLRGNGFPATSSYGEAKHFICRDFRFFLSRLIFGRVAAPTREMSLYAARIAAAESATRAGSLAITKTLYDLRFETSAAPS
jgi:hypothetical protein